MPRVELVTETDAPLLARPFFAGGDPGPIVASLAQVPELLPVAMPFVGAALGESHISARHKEFAILRTSAVMECSFCINAHTVVARDVGLTRQEVDGLRTGQFDLVARDERERALLEWIDEMAGGRGALSGDVVEAMHRNFADHEVVELAVVVGATMMLNRYCTGLDLPTSAGVRERLEAEGFA